MQVDQRWLRLMAMRGSSGLWDETGGMLHPDALRLSRPVCRRLARWCTWYDRYPDDQATLKFDYVKFSLEGRAIARAIKAELPDWSVFYFDFGVALTTVLADERELMSDEEIDG